jgi:hypothetical protein
VKSKFTHTQKVSNNWILSMCWDLLNINFAGLGTLFGDTNKFDYYFLIAAWNSKGLVFAISCYRIIQSVV